MRAEHAFGPDGDLCRFRDVDRVEGVRLGMRESQVKDCRTAATAADNRVAIGYIPFS